MANMRDIRRRIKSTKNTQQITKAMKMVSAAKLKRTQNSLIEARPFANKVQEVMESLMGSDTSDAHPFLQTREVKKVGYVLLSASRGLCGGYNSQLFRYADEVLKADERPKSIMVVGTRGYDFLTRQGYDIAKVFTEVDDNPTIEQGIGLSDYVANGYLAGEFDEVIFIYSEFISAMTQEPSKKQILPVAAAEGSVEDMEIDFIFEPGRDGILAAVMPKYLESTVFRLMLEAKAGEHGARMTSMSSATDNALEMIDRLTLKLNRARQAAITTEISEIVGGAAALQ